jgi:hypothetical protein
VSIFHSLRAKKDQTGTDASGESFRVFGRLWGRNSASVEQFLNGPVCLSELTVVAETIPPSMLTSELIPGRFLSQSLKWRGRFSASRRFYLASRGLLWFATKQCGQVAFQYPDGTNASWQNALFQNAFSAEFIE